MTKEKHTTRLATLTNTCFKVEFEKKNTCFKVALIYSIWVTSSSLSCGNIGANISSSRRFMDIFTCTASTIYSNSIVIAF
ncbi:hypothetical protein Syun_002079 [Stephania yunnanensis]|uniref:Uncharacterized protein n=1 Tax=Stephania yunnanensis TaxID=152371 RepID=A0AAP0LKT6_9MAGN